MTWRLRDDPEALSVAAARIEEATGIPASHLEKDFWVTEVLRAVAAYAASESTTVVFKGGTSLSKAYRLIHRFSEDVDLIVVTPGESKGAAHRCLKSIATAVEDAIGVMGSVDEASATRGVKRTVAYEYPGRHHPYPATLRRGVLMELGARGGTLPVQTKSICSLIAEHGPEAGIEADFREASAFEFRVLDPIRTLVEKLMILHHAAVAGHEDDRVRHARHYYDLWCLLTDVETTAAFSKWPCDALSREVETFSTVAKRDSSPRPPGGFAKSPAFVTPSQAVRDAYQQKVVGELLWNGSHQPTFDECCGAVIGSAPLL